MFITRSLGSSRLNTNVCTKTFNYSVFKILTINIINFKWDWVCQRLIGSSVTWLRNRGDISCHTTLSTPKYLEKLRQTMLKLQLSMRKYAVRNMFVDSCSFLRQVTITFYIFLQQSKTD